MIHPMENFRVIAGSFDSTPVFECFVPGIPRPQGSKTPGRYGGMREASKYVKAWRSLVTAYAAADWAHTQSPPPAPLDGPLVLGVEFVFPRPGTIKSPGRHYKRCSRCRGRKDVSHPRGPGWGRLPCGPCGASGLTLRPDAPAYVTCKPDVGKLLRAVEDSLTEAGVWGDDSLVVGYAGFPTTCKRYANPGEQAGVRIRIWRVT